MMTRFIKITNYIRWIIFFLYDWFNCTKPVIIWEKYLFKSIFDSGHVAFNHDKCDFKNTVWNENMQYIYLLNKREIIH